MSASAAGPRRGQGGEQHGRETDIDPAGDAGAPLIVTFDQWQMEPDTWIARGSPLGVVLSAAHKVEDLAPDLQYFSLIAAEFSGPSEGRGYTQARLLRERWNFGGELRATGHVRRDQLFFMAQRAVVSSGQREIETADFASLTAADIVRAPIVLQILACGPERESAISWPHWRRQSAGAGLRPPRVEAVAGEHSPQ